MRRILFITLLAACGGGSSGDGGYQPPIAHDDAVQTMEDTSFPLQTLLANDEHVDSYDHPSIMAMPQHGTINDSYSSMGTYTPDPGYHGSDQFTYALGDSTATVEIDVASDGVPYEQAVGVDGGPAIGLTTGDLDGDGRPDLAAIDTQTHSVVVMLDRSTPGAFAFDVERFEGGHTPLGLVLADVDGDGRLDVVTAAASDGVVVMRNATAGGTLMFDAPVLLPAGNATAVTAVDIDRDGMPDLVSTDDAGDQMIVRLDRSTPGIVAFDASYAFATAPGPFAVQAVDIDHAGGSDVVVLCAGTGALSLFSNATAIGDQVPAFAARVDRETGSAPAQLVSGDLDGDGSPELVVVQPGESSLRVYTNTGTTYAGARVDPLDTTTPTGAGIVDLDHTGGLDLVVGYGDSLEQLVSGAGYALSSRDSRVGLAHKVVAPAAASSIVQVDLDGVAPPELVIASRGSYDSGVIGTVVLFGD